MSNTFGNIRYDCVSCGRCAEKEIGAFPAHPRQHTGDRCVLIGQDGQVRLIDLKTGMQTVIEGFAFQQGDKFMPSPSGNKLLYYSSDFKADGLSIVRLGVVDLEKGTFIAFDREGYGNLYEEGIGWSNDSTVSINARSSDGKTRYFILYTF